MRHVKIAHSEGQDIRKQVWYVDIGQGLAVQRMYDTQQPECGIVHMASGKLVLSGMGFNREQAKRAMLLILDAEIVDWTIDEETLCKLMVGDRLKAIKSLISDIKHIMLTGKL